MTSIFGHVGIQGWSNTSLLDDWESNLRILWKVKRAQHYMVVFSPSVSSNSLLKMHLYGPWTGSCCRCKRNLPVACHKTPPWGVTGRKQSQPNRHRPILTTIPPQTETTRVSARGQCRLPQKVHECFFLFWWWTWRGLGKLKFYQFVISVIDTAKQRSFQTQKGKKKCWNVAGKSDIK